MSTHNRPARVAEEFRHALSELLARGLKDPRITGFITVTGAKMSPDLKEVTVYVSIHGEEKEREQTLEGLRAAATYLQREASRHLKLRHTPHLRFVYDESVARGDRIDRLLREAKAQDAERAAAPAPAGGSGDDRS
ncbi:30S ribosome-binding factor RbfA [Anaeromyxobacter oryzae]|uniref:Ribosome-binding factor A n=1 Tax=Anaeromyxobacter oryzae TaxID=2918170 RepID=A0ABN6MLV0_9BACT|nr:30S ribosome-binding factor RbfA [Anaeromyxobacter oryzae]BDG02027.1 ribosome-binding factor A [Anaeromyxobacter oryzae]